MSYQGTQNTKDSQYTKTQNINEVVNAMSHRKLHRTHLCLHYLCSKPSNGTANYPNICIFCENSLISRMFRSVAILISQFQVCKNTCCFRKQLLLKSPERILISNGKRKLHSSYLIKLATYLTVKCLGHVIFEHAIHTS